MSCGFLKRRKSGVSNFNLRHFWGVAHSEEWWQSVVSLVRFLPLCQNFRCDAAVHRQNRLSFVQKNFDGAPIFLIGSAFILRIFQIGPAHRPRPPPINAAYDNMTNNNNNNNAFHSNSQRIVPLAASRGALTKQNRQAKPIFALVYWKCWSITLCYVRCGPLKIWSAGAAPLKPTPPPPPFFFLERQSQ